MISRTNVDLRKLRKIGPFGIMGMEVGRIAAHFGKKGRYLLSAKLYRLGTWFYRQDAKQLNILLERYFEKED